MLKIQMRGIYILFLCFSFFLFTNCSSTEKNVKFAGSSLEKAKVNQGPEFAQNDYSQAETDYKSAESYMKEAKSDDAQKMADSSLSKSRTSIIIAKDKRAKQAIDHSDELIKKITQDDVKQVSLEQEKNKDAEKAAADKLEMMKQLKPAQDLLDEAKKHYQNGTKIAEDYKKKLAAYEDVKEESNYITEMDQAYQKAKQAEEKLQNEYNKYLVKNGDAMVAKINSDSYYNRFPEEKKKALADYEAFRTAVNKNDYAESEKTKPGYYNLEAFFNKKTAAGSQEGQEQNYSIIANPSSLEHVKVLLELEYKKTGIKK